MLDGHFYLHSSGRFISNIRDVLLVFFVMIMFIEIPAFNANSVDPDQTPLSLHCLQCSFYGTPGLKGLNGSSAYQQQTRRRKLMCFRATMFLIMVNLIVLAAFSSGAKTFFSRFFLDTYLQRPKRSGGELLTNKSSTKGFV